MVLSCLDVCHHWSFDFCDPSPDFCNWALTLCTPINRQSSVCTNSSGIHKHLFCHSIAAERTLRSGYYSGVRSGICLTKRTLHPRKLFQFAPNMHWRLDPSGWVCAHPQDLPLVLTSSCGWQGSRCMYSRRVFPKPRGWKSFFPSWRMSPSVWSLSMGYWNWRLPRSDRVSATTLRTRWKRTRMAVQATNQNTEAWGTVGWFCWGSTYARWQGIPQMVCGTATRNSKESVYPRDTFFVHSALVDAGHTWNLGRSLAHCKPAGDSGDGPETAPQREAPDCRDPSVGDWRGKTSTRSGHSGVSKCYPTQNFWILGALRLCLVASGTIYR